MPWIAAAASRRAITLATARRPGAFLVIVM
jgi:hypothetical protein